jgi:UDP-N-acetylglucosamine--N-acetylmuramyl-(pentapeptide) pyrophosphoryl-undecaprenol N-acetylglucosamine transferase
LTYGRPVLAALGGSQGAERLNDLILRSLPELTADYEIIHQTGLSNFEKVKQEAARLISSEQTASWHPMGFLGANEMRALYGAADCIISRAGAGAIFEIAAAGKPSILIPLDHGSRGEQIKNAYAYAREGAAIVLEENNLTPNLFVKTIRDLMADAALRQKMSEAAKKFATPEAANKIAEAILGFTI